MSRIRTVPHASWTQAPIEGAGSLTAVLEQGQVVFLPELAFVVGSQDANLFSPAILSSSKNASFEPQSGRVGGTTLAGPELERLRGVMARFSDGARALVDALCPAYRGRFERGRASFRPAEIAGRQTSWRKDDTRLHVDSFPASPVQGRRILRVFSNVNPEGKSRVWRVGGEFEAVAGRFAEKLSVPLPGTASLLRLLRVTKTHRTPYDALMLQLHDRMKEDAAFQQGSEQEVFEFPSGSTWMTFTDEVSHAARSGQYQLEQTFLLPIEAMENEGRSPLRILEKLKRRPLL